MTDNEHSDVEAVLRQADAELVRELAARTDVEATLARVKRRAGALRASAPAAEVADASTAGTRQVTGKRHGASSEETTGATTVTTWAPGSDIAQSSIMRGYDALNVNREINPVSPEIAVLVRESRRFRARACRFLASQTGITQFVDLGPGVPTVQNTHEIVQSFDPESTVVYVDNDPVVVAHGRVTLENNEHAHFVREDIFEPQRVLANEDFCKYIDFSRPVALLQIATLHYHSGPPWERSAEIMQQYIDALPAGSFVAISHFLDPEDEDYAAVRQLEDLFDATLAGDVTFRTRGEIEALFPGLEMVPPGVVPCVEWWPDDPDLTELTTVQRLIAGGIGRKP